MFVEDTTASELLPAHSTVMQSFAAVHFEMLVVILFVTEHFIALLTLVQRTAVVCVHVSQEIRRGNALLVTDITNVERLGG